jgi:CRP/FNR family cyclic AMP-dependent transcriptional regulator
MISPELLRRYPYFAKVSEDSLKKVAMIAEETSAPAGTRLFSEGDRADKLYILVDGEMDIQYTLGDGELRTVDTLVAGELMMWSALVEPYRSTATGSVKKDSKLIAVNGAKLRELCEQDQDLGYRLLICLTQLLATRLEGARVQLATI